MLEYGAAQEMLPDHNAYFSQAGFKQYGNGIRMDLPGWKDIYC